MDKAKGTYVYCLIAASRVPTLNRTRRGLPGVGPVRLLAIADGGGSNGDGRRPRDRKSPGSLAQWLAVADAPLELYSEAVINRHLSELSWVSRAAVAHEAVVESFIEQPAVLPMKLFTIFMNDDRALEHVHAERRRIAAILTRVVGHHEWGVRVALDANGAKTRNAKKGTRKRGSTGTGVAYLSLKKAQRDRAAELAQRAQETVAELYDRLGRLAAESKRRAVSELQAPGGPLLLDAAFLVPRGRSSQFASTVARETKALAATAYRVMTSGPWPPYSFVQD
jgi:hypothetical protein